MLILQEWMDTYGKDVINFAYSYVRNYHLAEDIAQDVFLRAFQKMHTFRGESAVKSWLLSITANRCKDHLRSWSARNELLAMEQERERPAESDTEQAVIAQLSRDHVWDTVLSLPEKYREVLVLYYMRDMSAKEVADALSLSDEAVRTRLHRGRDLLKKLLEGEYREDLS